MCANERPHGSVRGVPGNRHPYRDPFVFPDRISCENQSTLPFHAAHPCGRAIVGDVIGTLHRARSLALLLAVPLLANAAAPMHVKWEGLTVVVGKTVSIAMPGGAAITGKVTAVEADALAVDVKKTSDRTAYPKGVVRVPRATLHRFEMQTKGKVGRSVATPMGLLVGAGAGVGAWIGIQGGILNNDNPTGATVALIGITAAGTVGGYFIGNSVDKHWTPVEILP